jgi:hypothetical protein
VNIIISFCVALFLNAMDENNEQNI